MTDVPKGYIPITARLCAVFGAMLQPAGITTHPPCRPLSTDSGSVPSSVAYRAPEYTTVPPTHTPCLVGDSVPALNGEADVDEMLVELELAQDPKDTAASKWNPALQAHPHPLHPPAPSSSYTYRAFLSSRFPHGTQLAPCSTKPSAHLQLQLLDPAGVPAVEYLLLAGLLLLHAEQPPPLA